jgi:hypothetical protein
MEHYTFNVNCGFSMQYTFDETEIGPDGEPTEEAVLALEEEVGDHIRQNYGVNFFEVDVDVLLGVQDDATDSTSPEDPK